MDSSGRLVSFRIQDAGCAQAGRGAIGQSDEICEAPFVFYHVAIYDQDGKTP